MNLLLGKYEHTIDDKSRLTIPSKIRSKIGNEVFISKGFDGCLEVRSIEEFEKWTKLVSEFKTINDKARFFSREIFSNTVEVEVDGSGRIKIPANLMQLAGLEKDVFIIGAGDKLEIWNREQFDKYVKDQPQTFEEIANQLSNGEHNGK